MRTHALIRFALACVFLTTSAFAAQVETLVLFDPTVPETPESLQVDRHGNLYVSLSRLGEVRKILPDGTQETLALLPVHQEIQPCPTGTGRSAGLALDYQGNVYVGVISCNTADLGVWKITPGGAQSLVANLPGTARPNGMAYHNGWLYVADSRLALVWRLHSDGHSPATMWTNDPLLQHPPSPPPGIPGPNGLQIFDDEVYVSVSTRSHIVAFPILADGSAGQSRVHAILAADDFAFDKKGNLYAGASTQVGQSIVRVTPEGATEIVLTPADGLDGPTSAAFGVKNNKKNLYIANAAFPNFPGPTPRRPSIMRLHLGIRGEPRP